MTKRELLDALEPYGDDTPVFDSQGYDLKPHHVEERKYDDWDHATRDAEGWEVPAIGIGVAIGR